MKNTDWYFVTAMEVDTVIAPAKETHEILLILLQNIWIICQKKQR